jgi:hypothetical protein
MPAPSRIRERRLRLLPLQITLLTVRPISKTVAGACLSGAGELANRLGLLAAFALLDAVLSITADHRSQNEGADVSDR